MVRVRDLIKVTRTTDENVEQKCHQGWLPCSRVEHLSLLPQSFPDNRYRQVPQPSDRRQYVSEPFLLQIVPMPLSLTVVLAFGCGGIVGICPLLCHHTREILLIFVPPYFHTVARQDDIGSGGAGIGSGRGDIGSGGCGIDTGGGDIGSGGGVYVVVRKDSHDVVIQLDVVPHCLTLFLGDSDTIPHVETSFEHDAACKRTRVRVILLKTRFYSYVLELDGLGQDNLPVGIVTNLCGSAGCVYTVGVVMLYTPVNG